MRNLLLVLSLAGLTLLVSAGDILAQLRAYAGGWGSLPGVVAGADTGQKYSPSKRSGGQAVQDAPNASIRYASERSTHRFAGATRVVLDNFDPMDKDAKSASIQLDNNDVSFSIFGEPRVTTVYYQPFPVTLTRLNGPDTDGRNRRIFSVELPKDYAAAFGDHSLRLVAPVGTKFLPKGVRLMLMNLQGQVTDTLELRPPGNGSDASRFSVSLKPFAARSERQ